MTAESRNAIRALIESVHETITYFLNRNLGDSANQVELNLLKTLAEVEAIPEMRETVEAVFTDVPPTKHGWYWCRTINISKGDCPCMIIDAGRGLYFAEWGRLHAVPLVEVKGKQFSGPITP